MGAIFADIPGPLPPANEGGKRLVWTGTGWSIEETTTSSIPDAGQANGVATLNASGKVSQDPATARTAPIGNGIPKAGADKRIDLGWLSMARSFTQGAQTIPTDAYALHYRALKLAGTDTLTLEGTAELVVLDLTFSGSLVLSGRG
jgi:hypothetical protein